MPVVVSGRQSRDPKVRYGIITGTWYLFGKGGERWGVLARSSPSSEAFRAVRDGTALLQGNRGE